VLALAAGAKDIVDATSANVVAAIANFFTACSSKEMKTSS
jgi:hypothetical protein